MRRRALLLGLILAACSGYSGSEDGATLPDRADAGADAEVSTDASTSPAPDASVVDANAPACDLQKPFGAPAPITELNSTSNDDLFGDMSADELTVYFTSNRSTSLNLYAATRGDRNQPFGAIVPALPVPQGAFDVWNATVSADGLTVVFSSTRQGSAGADIYIASRAKPGSLFGTPNLVPTLNTSADDEGPRFTADGKILYFDSTTSGRRRIYSTRVLTGAFGAPQVVTELNVDTADTGVPVISQDGKTIYVYSSRAPTTGGGVWVATRTDTSLPFGTLAPVTEVNTGSLDAPGFISPDGCRLYTTGIHGADGKFHLYLAKRPL